jgi:hypothetical protein
MFMANLACSSLHIVTTIPHVEPDASTGDTSNTTASPELVAQVSHLEALLSSQQTQLNDSTLPGQDEDEDDDLAAELADLAESEKVLRKELEQLQLAGQAVKPNNKVWMTSVRDDPNILHHDRKRGWDLRWHLSIRASLVIAIVATIMLSRPIVDERQGALNRKSLVVARPAPVCDNSMETALAAFEPSLSEGIFPGDRLSKNLLTFDLSTAVPPVDRPSTSEASTAISVASQMSVSSVTPSCTGQTTIPAGSNAASFALAIIPTNNLPFYSSNAPFQLASIETPWQAHSPIDSSLGFLVSATFQSNHLQARLVRSHPLLLVYSARTDGTLAAELKSSQAPDTAQSYDTPTNLSQSLISLSRWNLTDPVAARSRLCRSSEHETGLDFDHLERQLLMGALGTTITLRGCRCRLEMFGKVQRVDEASVGVALPTTSPSAEEFSLVYYDFERPPVSQPQQGQGGVDWKQRFTKASLLLTATWSYADRFAPAIIGDHGTALPCV